MSEKFRTLNDIILKKCSLLTGFGVADFKCDIGFDIIKMADIKWRKNCINFEFFQTKSRTQGFSRSLMMNLIFFYGKTNWMIQNEEEIPKILIFKKKIDYLAICRVFNYESNIMLKIFNGTLWNNKVLINIKVIVRLQLFCTFT